MPGNTKALKYFSLIALVWTLIVGGSFVWNLTQQKDSMNALAKKDAIANFNKDQAFRFWASKHGGIYVKKDARTPSNPNLAHIPERDLRTPSGVELTLMNPAYMLRQMMDEFPEEYGVKGRIVSDKALWKPNEPDPWEAAAIEAFKHGSKEKFEFTMHRGEPYLRLMRPMIAEKSCLKCHAIQGYHEGDIRGGVEVVVKMAPYVENFERIKMRLIISHSVIFLVGMFLIGFGGRNFNRYLSQLQEKQLQAESFSDALEIKVAERTRDLEKANEQLKEMDKLKTMFIASMSHELRTPLNAIIGFTGILQQGLVGEINSKQSEHLERVNKAGHHLLAMITDVIDISKIEAGLMDVVVETFSLESLIGKLLEEMEPTAKAKGLSLVAEMEKDILLHTDKRRLHQCIRNYLTNAVKFTEKSGTIVIRAEELDTRVKIAVIDNGIGISREDRVKLFEAFERLDTRLRVKAGGAGLGLYVTRKIVEELLEGNVWMESEEESGSTFGLTISKKIAKKQSQEGSKNG
ncbi:MAG: ATP-binding protein [Sulfuricurvum sp.]|nr:ATP-binding protein [Sulfuricurvum sp.]